jgi:microcystin-dependent protein
LYDIGQKGGEETVALTVAELPVHSHVPNAATSASSTDPTGRYWAPAASSTPYGELGSDGPTKTANTAVMAADAVSAAGGGQPHENRMPTLALSYIIALQGIFPSRS